MVLKKFKPSRKRSDKPIVTIRRRQIQLNKKCQDFFEEAEFAELYYDDENKIIGIKLLKEDTDDSLKINIYPRRKIAIISVSHFIKFIGKIPELEFGFRDSERRDGEHSFHFRAEWDDKNKMIIVRLKQ